jgi:hypothetical protein
MSMSKSTFGSITRGELHEYVQEKMREQRAALIERFKVVDSELRDELQKRERTVDAERRVLENQKIIQSAFADYQLRTNATLFGQQEELEEVKFFIADYVFAHSWKGRRTRVWLFVRQQWFRISSRFQKSQMTNLLGD